MVNSSPVANNVNFILHTEASHHHKQKTEHGDMEKRIIVGVTVVVVAPLLYLGFKKLISVWRSSDRSTSSPQEIHNIDIEYDSLIATLKERGT
jgi:hypothetical protein